MLLVLFKALFPVFVVCQSYFFYLIVFNEHLALDLTVLFQLYVQGLPTGIVLNFSSLGQMLRTTKRTTRHVSRTNWETNRERAHLDLDLNSVRLLLSSSTFNRVNISDNLGPLATIFVFLE